MSKGLTQHTLSGRKYRLRRVSPKKIQELYQQEFDDDKTAYGLCDNPKLENPTIYIDNTLRGLEALETECHEIFHGIDYKRSEKYVEKSMTDMAKALWELGY